MQLLNERQRDVPAKVLTDDLAVAEIVWTGGTGFAELLFTNGERGFGSCVRCCEPPCMVYESHEIRSTLLGAFPADQEPAVCPTGAIQWLPDACAPEVQGELCIRCGLCVSRCPVKAIGQTDQGAVINDDSDGHWIELENHANPDLVRHQVARFANAEERGSLVMGEEAAALECFYEALAEIGDSQGAQFPNLLSRNLLIAVGYHTAMRRRGDQSVRMDLAGDGPGPAVVVVEVELGGAVMESPRDVLDDVAVLISRYGQSREAMLPLIVTDRLPSERAEYWRVIKDIREVLGLKVATVTLGALALLLWNRKRLPIEGGAFHIDADEMTLANHLAAALGRRVDEIDSHFPGVVSPAK